jgi:serine/threonine protein kinase
MDAVAALSCATATMTSERRILNDRYQLVYKLGAGGMGSVWLAEDQWLERTVALKELVQHDYGADLEERRTRALREARAMARVRHPAIVSIHDVFFEGDDPWIVMEYISGRSLDAIIKEANHREQLLDEQAIAAIGLPVLRGLCAAHRASVLHRDVKPANILVGNDDSIFLVDFGIAKITGEASITGTRQVLGTPEFLAPERLRGEEAGPAADLWSLGITLFYALEGYSPFMRQGGAVHEATMWAILHENPPPPARPGRLANVVLRLLHKDPAKRASVRELADVLRSIVTGVTPPRPERPTLLTQPMTSPTPQSRASAPRAPAARSSGQPPSRPVELKRAGLPMEDAREVIRNVSTDTGVAMLLAMPDDQAAKILASYPSGACSELIQGVAAARPDKAGSVLRMLLTADAARMMGYLKPDVSASILTTMPTEEAVRMLGRTGVRTTAGIITKLPVEAFTPLTKAIPVKRTAEVLAFVQPDAAAALLLAAPDDISRSILRELKPLFRTQVMRFL